MTASTRLFATRPAEQNALWVEKLKGVGEKVVELPLLEIRALSEASQRQAIKQTVLSVDEYKHWIFVSQNAVNFAFDWIDDFWPELPAGVEFYAVGEKTKVLLESKLNAFACVQSSTQSMTSEELLKLPSLQEVKDHKVLIFRGLGGRNEIKRVLEERGARVTYCELYSRRLPLNASKQLRKLEIRRSDCAFIFSGDSLLNWNELIATLSTELQSTAKSASLILPSERVESMARELGFKNIYCAQNASEDAMLEAYQKCFAKRIYE